MSPKLLQRLKDWQTKHKERWAKALLGKPRESTLRKVIHFPGVLIIMGSRRSGKTGLAMEIMDDFHTRKNIPGAVCYPQRLAKLRKLLPRWVKIVTRIQDLPANSICIVDEASQIAHARRSQSQAAVDLDGLVAISAQKNQLIIFITHHARKLDILDIQATDMVIWKQPTLADTIFERDELLPYVLRAWEIFDVLTPAQALRTSYVMNFRKMDFCTFRNGLPPWWSSELSTVFKLFENGGSKNSRKETQST